MRVQWALVAVLSMASIGLAGSWSQTDLAPPATPSAQPAAALSLAALLDAHAQARGGRSIWAKVQSVHYSGTLSMGGTAVPFTLDVARPGKLRMALFLEAGTALQVFDGKQGWTSTPSLGQAWVQPVTGADLQALARQADIDGPLVDPESKGYEAALLGKSEIGGTEVHGIVLRHRADGNEETHYLDAQSFLPVQQQTQTRVQGQPVRTDVRFSDYRDIDGRLVPFATENVVTTAAGVVSQQLKLTEVSFNLRYPRGHFEEPKVTE